MAAAPRDGYSIVGANAPQRRPTSFIFAAWWAAAGTGIVAASVALAAVVGLFASSSLLSPSVRVGRWYAPDASNGGNAGLYPALPVTKEQKLKAAFHVPHVLTTSNLPLKAYVGKNRRVLAGCVVRGPGVEKPTIVGQPTHLVITLPKGLGADGQLRELSAEGQRAWKEAQFAYATFENDEGVFGAWGGRRNDSGAEIFKIDFKPPQAGTFKLTVDLFSKTATWPIHHRRNATVEVHSSPAQDGEAQRVQRHVARCQGLPDARGLWYKCATARGLPHPEECLRWGYSFRPHNGSCFYENWTPRDLLTYATNASQPKQWILIVGTSRVRGLFLSAADHLLDGRRGEFATTMGKCWGRMDVDMGNVRLTFQDFRGPSILPWPLHDDEKRFQCHGDKQASYDDGEFARNSSHFLQNIFDPAQQPDGLTPTHLVFEYNEKQDPAMYRDVLFSALPPDWEGSATAIFFRSPFQGNVESPGLDRTRREEWASMATVTATPDGAGRRQVPVDLIDTLEIIRPWLRASEFGVYRASQHWHSCTEAEGANNATRTGTQLHTTRPVPFGVQGLVTDQLAQMIFHKALGPRPPRELTLAATAPLSPPAAAIAGPPRPGLKVCMECPPSLLPFNIKPQADLECHDGIPRGEFKAHYTPVLPDCPAWCRQQQPISVMHTQSGPVDLRDCRKMSQALHPK